MVDINIVVEEIRNIMDAAPRFAKADMKTQDEKAQKRLKEDANRIEALCLEKKFAMKTKMKARYIAVHPCNRGGSMIEGIDVHDLLHWVHREGCSTKEMVNPWAFWKQEGAKGKEQELANFNLIEASGGLLPDQDP